MFLQMLLLTDSRATANAAVLKMNYGAHGRTVQNENVDYLNQRRIKLEDNLQWRRAFISNVLKRDVQVVNLGTNSAMSNANQMQIDGQLPNEDELPDLIEVHTEDLFCAAILIASKLPVVIRLSWIKNFEIAKSLNKGIRSAYQEVVYYSLNIDDAPNFDKPVVCDVMAGQPALYMATIYRFFGKHKLLNNAPN